MVNAQEWLDRKYPKEERSKVWKIEFNEPGLEGELDLSDFTYRGYWNKKGIKIFISPQVNETKLIFKNLPEKAEIIPVVAQRYINYHYPKNGVCQRETDDMNIWDKSIGWNNKGKKREEITRLDISKSFWSEGLIAEKGKALEGDLDLSDFVNLEGLNVTGNQITSLILPKKLTMLSCTQNKLFTLDVSKCLQLNILACDLNVKPLHLLVEKVQTEERKKISNIYQELNTKQPNLEKFKKEFLTIQIEDKKNELESLKNTLKNKLDENSAEWLDTFLEAQVALEQGNIIFIRNQFNKAREKLKEKLSEEEISSLHRLQIELTYLEKELEKLETEKMEAKIENN